MLSTVNSKNVIIYTNDSEIEDKIDADLVFMQKRNTEEPFWNLEFKMKVYDAELLIIAQAFNWLCKNIYSSTRHV